MTTAGRIWELQINIPNFSFSSTCTQSFIHSTAMCPMQDSRETERRQGDQSQTLEVEQKKELMPRCSRSNGAKYYRWSWVCLQVVFLMDLNVRTEGLNCRFPRKCNFGGDQTQDRNIVMRRKRLDVDKVVRELKDQGVEWSSDA